MSAPKFTPGPWVDIDYPDRPCRIIGGDDGAVEIAKVWATDLPHGAANKALVTASPDLYAALEALLAFVEQATLAGVLDAGEMQDNVECAEARAALARARGEA